MFPFCRLDLCLPQDNAQRLAEADVELHVAAAAET